MQVNNNKDRVNKKQQHNQKTLIVEVDDSKTTTQQLHAHMHTYKEECRMKLLTHTHMRV